MPRPAQAGLVKPEQASQNRGRIPLPCRDEGDEFLVFGELVLDATFISPEGKELYQDKISRKTRLENKRFLSLAKGLSATLAEAVEEMRERIERTIS